MNDTTHTNNPAKLSYKALMTSMEQLIDMKCPLTEWMKEEGFDPAKGGRLIIDTKMAIRLIPHQGQLYPLPSFVIVNDQTGIGYPFLIQTYEHLFDIENLKMSCQNLTASYFGAHQQKKGSKDD